MKKFSILVVLCFFLMVGNAMADALVYNNVRPTAIGVSSDGPAWELSVLLPMFDVIADQESAGYWTLGGLNPVAIPVVAFEVTANSNTMQMGIFSDLNGDTDALGRTEVDIFNGPAAAGTSAGISFNLVTGLMSIAQVSGPAGAVNAGAFAGITPSGFGFYINPTGGDIPVWYSLDQLNNGLAQMVAFNEPGPNRWTICFEDVAVLSAAGGPNGDYDYNDFIFQIESITPVPEPATMLLLGSGLLGLAGLGRRKFFKKNA